MYKLKDNVTIGRFNGELLALNTATGVFLKLEKSTCFLLESLILNRTNKEIATEMADKLNIVYDESMKMVVSFIYELEKLEMIEQV